MSDVLLGTLPDITAERDAIHVAVMPMFACEKLWPGDRVGVQKGAYGFATRIGVVHVGIVDPFLTDAVQPDQIFWMLLFPNTVTGMRHQWEHPMFDPVELQDVRDVDVSEEWLRKAANTLGVPYERLIAEGSELETDNYINKGEHVRNLWYEMKEEFWKHHKIVTGRDVPKNMRGGFTCSC